jgi:UDP-GlcNAc:undecaprenyl-phosphate GlcNAc-1-phosphate transferase
MAGALVAFLLVNRPPAKMFLGDAGSLPIGLTAGIMSISAADAAHGLHSLILLVMPVAIPLLDTSLVIASRLATSRPIQLGGTDHASHRLLLIGWTPTQVLLGALATGAAAGAITFLALRYPFADAWLALPITAAFAAVWVVLFRIDPYHLTVAQSDEQHA